MFCFIIVEENMDHIETKNQKIPNQENEPQKNNTKHLLINFRTTDEATQIDISTQPEDSKPATPHHAPNIYFLFLLNFDH